MSEPKQLGQGYRGSILSGTMRPEDCLPAFMSLLEQGWSDEAQRLSQAAIDEGWPHGRDVTDLICNDPFSEKQSYIAMSWLLEEIEVALDSIAPEGTYFGTSEGDGADWGFWSYDEQTLQDIEPEG